MADKAYFGYQNLIPSATLTARTASATYPVTNLTKHQLWPGYRSADRYLVLNGTDEYAYVPDHADFSITGDMTIEFVMTPDIVTGNAPVLNKFSGAGSGYAVYRISNVLRAYINGTGIYVTTSAAFFTAGTAVRGKVVYDASAAEVSIYQNGVEVARANNATQTGCTLTGTLPTAMTDNAIRVTIGANAGGGELLDGKIGLVGIVASEDDHGGYLDPTACAGYWNFDSDDLTDSSGNSHTLTGVGIDTTNYADCTAYQWITSLKPSAPYADGTFAFLDRRHNLSTGAVVKLIRSGVYSPLQAVVDTAVITAGQAIVLGGTASASDTYSFEIHDPDNTDGYIELPYIYLGDLAQLLRNANQGGTVRDEREGTVIKDSVGGYTTYVRSEQLWRRTEVFPTDYAADKVILDAIHTYAGQGYPVIYSEDGSEALTRLVYVLNAMQGEKTHQSINYYSYAMDMSEVGGGF